MTERKKKKSNYKIANQVLLFKNPLTGFLNIY